MCVCVCVCQVQLVLLAQISLGRPVVCFCLRAAKYYWQHNHLFKHVLSIFAGNRQTTTRETRTRSKLSCSVCPQEDLEFTLCNWDLVLTCNAQLLQCTGLAQVNHGMEYSIDVHRHELAKVAIFL